MKVPRLHVGADAPSELVGPVASREVSRSSRYRCRWVPDDGRYSGSRACPPRSDRSVGAYFSTASQPDVRPVLMVGFVLVDRCGAAPDSHRVPSSAWGVSARSTVATPIYWGATVLVNKMLGSQFRRQIRGALVSCPRTYREFGNDAAPPDPVLPSASEHPDMRRHCAQALSTTTSDFAAQARTPTTYRGGGDSGTLPAARCPATSTLRRPFSPNPRTDGPTRVSRVASLDRSLDRPGQVDAVFAPGVVVVDAALHAGADIVAFQLLRNALVVLLL